MQLRNAPIVSWFPRNTKTIVAAYTQEVLIDSVYVNLSSAAAVTLYDIVPTLKGTIGGAHYYSNIGTAPATLTPASGNTIEGYTSWILHPGQAVVIAADKIQKKWEVRSPLEKPLSPATDIDEIVVDTNGTTAVNMFGAAGAPYDMEVIEVYLTALDTTAGNVIPKNAGSNIVTIAKGTTAGVMVGGVTLANNKISQGAAVTVVSSSAGNGRVVMKYRIAAGQSTP